MNHRTHLLGALCLLSGLGLSACGTKANPPANTTDSGADTPAVDTPATDAPATDAPATDAPATDAPQVDAPPADAAPASALCTMYCTQLMTNCTGANAQYEDTASCLAYCASARWPEGMAGATSGNTLACRIYHGGGPAMTAPATHCPHAGPTGDNTCGSLSFRTEAPVMYRRVDRMGMPAVSTVLISGNDAMGRPNKNLYNDVTTRENMMALVPIIITTLTGLHTALDRHLMAAGLTPCSMTVLAGGLPECLGQVYGGTATVASLVVPDDAIVVTPSGMAGFPNGRRLADPVIDVTLSVLLLRMGSSCPGGTCSPATLATPGAGGRLPLNPPRNDVALPDTFPYLAPAHAPAR